MKHTRKIASLLLALVMVFALATTAFAQEVIVTGDGKGSITISNAAKGETYTIYKLFDATVSADGKHIAYTGTIPSSMSTYFTKDTAGNISATSAAKDGEAMSDGLKAALKDWAKTATATTNSVVSDGSVLTFSGLPYGYYVVTTTQGQTAISVDSTMPDVTIVDKNSSTPHDLHKNANTDNVKIGDTVTYTISFKTANYSGAGEAAKKIVSYTIEDTLPPFLSDVIVTSIIVDDDADAATTNDQYNVTAQFADKKIVLDWYDETNAKFLYNNGASVTITYTAVVTDKAAIDGAGNTNKVTLTWTDEGGTTPGQLEKEETIYTYALALKKVDDKGRALADAVFQFPFYVKTTADTDGAYIYAGTYTAEEYSQLTEMQKAAITNTITTPDDGIIVVKGVKAGDEVTITEVTAPAGYNKLTAPVKVTPVKTNETSTHKTVYLDENGNVVAQEVTGGATVLVDLENIAATPVVVVNKTGTELPSTGGIGTTIFYVMGSILVLGAAVLLVTKKRMAMNG